MIKNYKSILNQCNNNSEGVGGVSSCHCCLGFLRSKEEMASTKPRIDGKAGHDDSGVALEEVKSGLIMCDK